MELKKPKILLIYPVKNDPQSMILYEEIMNKGGHPILLPFTLKREGKALTIKLTNEDVFIGEDLNNVGSVFIRGISVNAPVYMPPYVSDIEHSIWNAKYKTENYKIYLISTILKVLEAKGAKIVNSIESYLHHNTKTQLAQLLKSNGISTPLSFATNSSELIDLKIQEGNDLVLKSACGIGATEKLTEKYSNQKEELLKCPALFQEEIKGNTIRVHTVGNKVILALRILSNYIDSRTNTQGFEVIQLNSEHEEEFRKANELLGLHFSAWDAIINSEGKIFLLDCNPGPYIFWIGNHFTRLVKSELAKYLIKLAESASYEEAEKTTKRAETLTGSIFSIEKDALPLLNNTLNSHKPFLRQKH